MPELQHAAQQNVCVYAAAGLDQYEPTATAASQALRKSQQLSMQRSTHSNQNKNVQAVQFLTYSMLHSKVCGLQLGLTHMTPQQQLPVSWSASQQASMDGQWVHWP